MSALLLFARACIRVGTAREIAKAGVTNRARRMMSASFFTLLLSCSGAGTDVVPITSLEVVPVTTTVPVGEVRQLEVRALDANGASVEGRSVTWSSSDPYRASVTSTGLVTAHAPGTVTITATSDGQTATVVLNQGTLNTVIQKIYAGNNFTCALNKYGNALCWGENFAGNLGIGSYERRLTPTYVSGTLTFSMLATGGRVSSPAAGFTCGITTTNAAYCWGWNQFGQLGDGTTTQRTKPVPVAGGHSFTAIAAGATHACGLSEGAAYCWGYNYYGNLGDGTTTDHMTPVAVQGGISFSSLSLGEGVSCGLSTDGQVYCWGANFRGQLGDQTTIDRHVPTLASGGARFQLISTSMDARTCGLTMAGTVTCWGKTDEFPPNERVFASMSAGGSAVCGLDADGWASCWGNDSAGQLGDDKSTLDPSHPVAVHGGVRFTQISTGALHTCGITAVGAGYCWGEAGTIGDGEAIRRYFPSLIAVP